MAKFEPQPRDLISLNSAKYQVMPHPGAPMMAFGQEGRKAIVYQLKDSRRLIAFKIFKPKFRVPDLLVVCESLSHLDLPGLEVCKRQCLTRQSAESLIERYPEAEYAVLMPWIEGLTWFDIVFGKMEISERESQELAKSIARVLTTLERRGYAHCDIAGGNVVVDASTGAVSLIDVEDMFGPGLPRPNALPRGTGGYQHQVSRTAKQGQWCAAGDRFSAAILLAETLTWHHPEIRQEADEEHYFAEDELQGTASTRYGLMLRVLASISRPVADCFEAAWRAPTLTAAPSLGEWAELLESIQVPLLPKKRVKEPFGQYQCTTCATLFEKPAAGGRCPRCGAKTTEQIQAAITARPAPRSVWGFRCLSCAYEVEYPSAGGRCPNCGGSRMVQAVIQAVSRPVSVSSDHHCPQCKRLFTQPTLGGRCPNCGAKINVR